MDEVDQQDSQHVIKRPIKKIVNGFYETKNHPLHGDVDNPLERWKIRAKLIGHLPAKNLGTITAITGLYVAGQNLDNAWGHYFTKLSEVAAGIPNDAMTMWLLGSFTVMATYLQGVKHYKNLESPTEKLEYLRQMALLIPGAAADTLSLPRDIAGAINKDLPEKLDNAYQELSVEFYGRITHLQHKAQTELTSNKFVTWLDKSTEYQRNAFFDGVKNELTLMKDFMKAFSQNFISEKEQESIFAFAFNALDKLKVSAGKGRDAIKSTVISVFSTDPEKQNNVMKRGDEKLQSFMSFLKESEMEVAQRVAIKEGNPIPGLPTAAKGVSVTTNVTPLLNGVKVASNDASGEPDKKVNLEKRLERLRNKKFTRPAAVLL